MVFYETYFLVDVMLRKDDVKFYFPYTKPKYFRNFVR